VDGYIARDAGDIAWLTDPPPIAGHAKPPADPLVIPGYEEHLASVDHLVMGRGTYEKVLTFGFWPYPQQHVIVLSRTLVTDDPRITVATSTEEALRLLAERGSTAPCLPAGADMSAGSGGVEAGLAGAARSTTDPVGRKITPPPRGRSDHHATITRPAIPLRTHCRSTILIR